MGKYASKAVAQAQAWIGLKESNGSHKQIIDLYNAHTPLARGYKVKYTDAWCATTISAIAIKLGYTDIIPTECGCEQQIKLFQKLGSWVENDNYVPKPGDIIYYDWNDNGVGDNTGYSDHVGIVEKVASGKITVIEGNYGNAVQRRVISVGAKNIRGYGVPKYDAESTTSTPSSSTVNTPTNTTTKKEVCKVEISQLQKGSKGNDVKALQTLLIGYGYSCGKYGADGDFGDGTLSAVRAYQKAKKLTVDGIVGAKTWKALLGA